MGKDTRTEVKTNTKLVVSFACRAGIAAFFEAGEVLVAVVPAAAALEEGAAEGARVSDLGCGEGAGRHGECGVVLAEFSVGGNGVYADEGADAGAGGGAVDAVEAGEAGDVVEAAGADVVPAAFHEVGAASADFACGGSGFLEVGGDAGHGAIG